LLDRQAHKQDVMVLWFGTEVLEDTLLPESLHVIPILNHAMSNGVVQSIRPVDQSRGRRSEGRES
jgi:hypothetical protein